VRVVISNSAGAPLYEQIEEQIKTAILSGDLTEGDPLPSVRALARDLRISVITVTRTYGDLAREGFIVNVPGKGSYVLPTNSDLVREQLLRGVEDALSAAVRSARIAGLTQPDLIEMLDQAYAANVEGDIT
jgi:GntR family transcriptional regulator